MLNRKKFIRKESKLVDQCYIGKFCLNKGSMYIFYRETEKGQKVMNNFLGLSSSGGFLF